MNKRCMGCMKTYGKEFDICPHCGYIEGSPAREAYHMAPGTILHGKYIVGKVVGYGGFGVTYIGWDAVLEQAVAIKEYLPSEFATRVPGQEAITIYSGEKEAQFSIGKSKFFDEARRLAKFNSVEGVVEIWDTFTDNATAYIVMEFLEGETLKEKINREGKLTVEESLLITKSILKTLEEVHKGEIIHRDIAPDNIFLCNDDKIKILDFGASRYATVQHSKSLSVILKEGYAPEEQYRSKGQQGSWSDVYAVGATTYKMLTGVTPEDAMERAENDKLKPVSKYGVKLSKGEETALMNAMNVFAEDRTQTAGEFLAELEAEEVKRKERTRKKIDLGKWPLWSKVLLSCIAITLVATGFMLSKKSTFALEDGQAYVPEVINMNDDKATNRIEKNELTVKIIGQEKSDKVEAERVMSQYPDAGRVVNTGELVELRISAGDTVVMVDLTGMTKEEAQALLEIMGFTNVKFKEKESAAPVGTVVGQSVKIGEEADINARLTVTLSKGMGDIDPTKDTMVPKFVGMQFNNALNKATEKKLYIVKGSTKASREPAGTILSQNISGGSTVKQGTTITVVVSSGEKKVEVPYVTYMKESEAKSTLKAYVLGYSVTYEYSENVSKGLVISQSVEAGKKVSPGTNVSLVVSKGRKQVSVPNVVGMNESSAYNTLLNNDLRYAVVYSHSENVGWGKVISASPTGKQERGTKVTLTVSCGTSGKLVTESEYNSKYSDSSKYSADKRYRYATRTKEYTTSTSSSLSGWTKYNTKTTSSTSGYWFGKYPEDTATVKIVDKGYYYYAYGVANPNKTSDWSYYLARSRSNVVAYMKENFSSSSAYDESRLRYFWYISKNYYNPYLPSGVKVYYCDNSNVGVMTTSYTGTYNMDLKLYYYSPCYKKKTITTTYYYWKWGEWSSWSDWTTKQSTGDSVKEDSAVMYYVVGKAPY